MKTHTVICTLWHNRYTVRPVIVFWRDTPFVYTATPASRRRLLRVIASWNIRPIPYGWEATP